MGEGDGEALDGAALAADGAVVGAADGGATDGCGVAEAPHAARIGARAASGPALAAVSSSWRRLIRRAARAR